MSTKAERARRKLKAQKQAAAAQAQHQPSDEFRKIKFGVMTVDGVDSIVRIGELEAEPDLYDQNHGAFNDTIKRADENKSWSYMNYFTLSEVGRAYPSYTLKAKAGEPTDAMNAFNAANERFQQRIESQYYDQEFPEHAAEMNKLAQKYIRDVSAATAVPVQLPEGAVINPEYLESIVREYLTKAKDEILKTGKAKAKLGWGVDDGVFFYEFGLHPLKYRFGRVVSEVAATINSPFVLFGSEGWLKNEKGDRIGEELLAHVILPDGSVPLTGSIRFYRNPLRFDEIQIAQDAGQYAKQYLFPKWAYFSVPATVAA